MMKMGCVQNNTHIYMPETSEQARKPPQSNVNNIEGNMPQTN